MSTVSFYCPVCGALGYYDGHAPSWWPDCPSCAGRGDQTRLRVVGPKLPLTSANLWAHHVVDALWYASGGSSDRRIDLRP